MKRKLIKNKTTHYKTISPIEVPSMDYLIKKEFSNFRKLQKDIVLKEILFKNCHTRINDFSLESVQLEKELGELYAELMKAAKALNINCETLNLLL